MTTRTVPAKKERLVVVGNGMAGLRLLEELVKVAPDRYEMVVIGAEPEPAYNRVLLSSYLAGDTAAAELLFRDLDWYAARNIRLVTGQRVTAIRPARKEIVFRQGHRLGFDKLVLATGSEPMRLPLPGADLDGVVTFRNVTDVACMKVHGRGSRAVVIGGGLLGLEAAYGLARRGLAVTLLHIMPRLMERQLDAHAANLLRREMQALGIQVELQAHTAAIEDTGGGAGKADQVRLKDGRRLKADLVVMATGVKPQTDLAERSGLLVKRGIVVDDQLSTSVPGVFAIGECAEHRGVCYGLVEPAYAQAHVLARQLAGETARYEGTLLATSLKVSGVNVFSAGNFEVGPGTEGIVLTDSQAGTYRKLVLRDGKLEGAILYGDVADARWYRELIEQKRSIGPMRTDMIFGRDLVEAA